MMIKITKGFYFEIPYEKVMFHKLKITTTFGVVPQSFHQNHNLKCGDSSAGWALEKHGAIKENHHMYAHLTVCNCQLCS